MLIFNYGSNLCLARLRQRAPAARVVATGRLRGYSLRFHKRGQDGSGKCDAFFTGLAEDAVWGAIAEIDSAEAELLDRAEGLGRGYEHHSVEAETPGAAPRGVVLYRAQREFIDPSLKPFTWYKRYVLEGARQHGFPAKYLRQIEAIAAIEDPDAARRRLHRAVRCGER